MSSLAVFVALLLLCVACMTTQQPVVLEAQRADAERLFREKRYEEALVAFLDLAERAAEAGDDVNRVEGLALAARMETLLRRLPEARVRLATAWGAADKSEPRGWSRCLLVRGIVERESGDKVAARATFEEAYHHGREHGLELRAVDAAHFVAMLGDLETSLEWTRRALAAAEAANDDRWQAVLWNNLGWAYADAGRLDEGYDALVSARTFHHRAGDERARYVADWSVAELARRRGHPDEARELLEPVLAWAEARYRVDPIADSAEWAGLAHRSFAELELEAGRNQRALVHFEGALALLREAGMAEWSPADLEALEVRTQALRATPDGS